MDRAGFAFVGYYILATHEILMILKSHSSLLEKGKKMDWWVYL
jgi:hypothetical protein